MPRAASASAPKESSPNRRRRSAAPVVASDAPIAASADDTADSSDTALLSALLEQSGAGIASTDARGRLTQTNPAFQRTLELRAQDLQGLPLEALAASAQEAELRDIMNALLAGERASARLDLKRELDDDRTLWVDLQLHPLRNAAGHITGLAVTATDQTKRKQEEALRLQHQILAMQNAGLGLWSWDLKKNHIGFDMLWAMVLGCAVSDIPPVPATWAERMHPDDYAHSHAAMLRCLKGQAAEFATEHRMRHQDGHWVWLFTNGMVTHRSPEGLALQVIGTSQDITQRKTAEAALELSRLYQSLALQSAGLGQWEHDVRSGAGVLDARFHEMFGYQPGELAQHISSRDLIDYVEDRPAAAKVLAAVINGPDDEYRQVCRRRHKLGHTVWVHNTGRVIERDANGRAVRLVGLYQDITEQVQHEAALRKAKEAADAASNAKGEFLANMSHEIRTPMNAIIGLTRLVLDTELNARQRDYLTKVHSASKALLGILNDVLDYSKIEAGRMDLEQIQFSLEEPLNSVANLFGAQVEQKGLELFFEMAPDVPMEVIGDPMRLTQVLNNLVGNAIKFTDQGEIRIKVELAASDDAGCTLRAAVSDTGIGLSKDQASNLFQAFTQADNSVTRKYGGTGLGLTISQKLVQLMDGEIAVSSIEGQGCTFSFTFKVRRPATAAQHALDLQRLRGLRALVVDDQETSRVIMENMIGTWGMAVETTPSAAEGLARVREHQARGTPFDVVLLDWRMPTMNGLEMAREMRAMSGPGQCPPFAVMVTGFGREQLLKEADDVPLDVVLTKPVVPSALFDILTRLQQPGGAPSAITPRPVAVTAAVRFDGARVLLAEDNFLNQEVATEFLRSYGAVVTIAGDGAQALALARTQPFDMVLMDLHMPVMDGVESARAIRALPGCAQLPIVAMTAAVMSEDRGRCEAAGMVDFVAKPVDPDDLVRAMRRWLSKARPVRGDCALAAPASATNAATAATAAPARSVYAIKLAGFDPGAALRRMRGNEERLLQLLRTFHAQHQESLAQLRLALAIDDREESMRQLHSIKGVSGTLGLMTLANAANSLEMQVKAAAGPVDESEFVRAITETLQALSSLASAPPAAAAATQAAAPLSAAQRETLQRVLADLSRYVREQELVPDELIDQLRSGTAGALAEQPVAQLCRHLFDFDHEAALTDLRQMSSSLELDLVV